MPRGGGDITITRRHTCTLSSRLDCANAEALIRLIAAALTLPTYSGSFPVNSSSTKNWFQTQLRLCLRGTSQGPGSERGDLSRSPELGLSPQQLPHSHRGSASASRARALATPERRHPAIWARAKKRAEEPQLKKDSEAEMSEPSGLLSTRSRPPREESGPAHGGQTSQRRASLCCSLAVPSRSKAGSEKKKVGHFLHSVAEEVTLEPANRVNGERVG